MATQDYLRDFLDISREDITQLAYSDETIALIKNSIKQWLNTKKRLDKKLMTQYNKIKKEKNYKLGRTNKEGENIDLSSSGLKQLAKTYAEQKRKIRNIHDITEMTEHFKKGYELIHYTREYLTKQELTYSILYTGGKETKGANLLEAHLKMKDILSNISLTMSDVREVQSSTELSNAMNLSINNSAIKRTIDALLGKAENQLEMLVNQLDKPALWDSLMGYRDNKRLGYKGNAGQLYEVYSILRKRKKYQSINYIGHEGRYNTERLAETLLNDAISNNDPGWQIGDVGLEQLKSVYNGAANLISVSTIEKVLKETYNAFSLKDSAQVEKALKEIYTTQREHFNNELDSLAETEAIAAIEDSIRQIFDKK